MEIYGVRSWRMAAGTCQGQPRQVGDEHLGATDRAPAIVVRMSCAPMSSPPAPSLSRPSAGALKVATKASGGVHVD